MIFHEYGKEGEKALLLIHGPGNMNFVGGSL